MLSIKTTAGLFSNRVKAHSHKLYLPHVVAVAVVEGFLFFAQQQSATANGARLN